MKKGILLLFAAGAILASCGGAQNEEAAKAYCDCYKQAEAAQEGAESAAGNAESVDELMAASSNLLEEAKKVQECLNKWQSDYDGKIDSGFEEALKAQDEEIWKKAKEAGIFE